MPTLNTQSTALLARLSVNAPETAATEFMVMPAGLHRIYPSKGSKNGKAVDLLLQVDSGTAAALQQQLGALQARSGHRPYFDFNHDDNEASFWPSEFVWRDSPKPGVYARGEWSAKGKEAVLGKMYRSFSPVFHVDSVRANPARVVAEPSARLNMGGLVNDPAFKENLPFWAKDAGAPGQANKNQKDKMTPEEKAELQAKRQTLEQEINDLLGQPPSTEVAESLTAKRAELDQVKRDIEHEELRARNTTLEQQLLAQRTKDAETAVKDAVRRGAIPAKDEALQAKWKQKCIEDQDNIALLAGMRGAPALQASPAIAPARLTLGASITRESNQSVLGGMDAILARNRAAAFREKPQHAREFAAIYAKEIVPRLREGDDIPLMGANAFGTLAATMVSTRVLELLAIQFPILSAICTNFSDEIVSYGDTLNTRFVTVPTVTTYNQTTGWASSDMTTTDVAITYDNLKGVQIAIDDQTIAGTVRRLFEEIAPAQAYALGKDIVDAVYGVITAANFTETPVTQPLVNFARPDVISVGTALTKRGVPMGTTNRTLLLNSDYFGKLFSDSAIVSLASYQRPQVIEQGDMIPLHGFKVYDCPNLPTTNSLAGFGFSKSALCLATRLSGDYINAIPGAGNGTSTVVTTPGGFSARQVQFVDNKLAHAYQRLEVIYGKAKGQQTAGQRLTSA